MSFLSLNPIEQKKLIEALIFTSEEPLSVDNIINLLVLKLNKDDLKNNYNLTDELINSDSDIKNQIEKLIIEINNELIESDRPFNIKFSSGTYKYAILPEVGELLLQYSKFKTNKRLSQAALEVLAIIAYKQPISKPEIEQIRGINSNEVVNSLLEKNLIKISGKSDILGKPLLYSTTEEFLRTFGLNSLNDLPQLKEFDDVLGNLYNKDNNDNNDNNNIIKSEDFEFIKFIDKDELKNL